MITTTVSCRPAVAKAPKYPYLGVSEKGRIVFFSRPGEGIMVRARLDGGLEENPVWAVCYNWAEELFTPLEGQVILENANV